MIAPEYPKCPVCHNIMTPSVGVNYGGDVVYQCQKRVVHIENIGLTEVVDAVYFIRNLQPLEVSLKVIEIYPFTFSIYNQDNLKKTIIKVEKREQFANFVPLLASKETVLEIPYPIDLPWDDRDKVLEKIKTYVLFS